MDHSTNPGLFQGSFFKGIRDFFYNPNYGAQKADPNNPPVPWMPSGSTIINHSTAETIAAYFICLKIKAETFASINTGLYRIKGDRIERDMSHPLDYILSIKPNSTQNAYDWWFATQWMEDLHGNAYSRIMRDKSNRPGELVMLDPLSMTDIRIDKVTNEIYYIYKGEAIPAYDILHFKQNSNNGYSGRSDITMNRETFELSKEQEYYARRTFGKKPQGIMETDNSLDPSQVDQISGDFGRVLRTGGLPIAHSGLKYKAFNIPPGDAQYIESRQFTKAEICAIKRIPLSMIQDYSRQAGATYNNVGEQKASFYTDVILPGSRMKETEMLTKLISRENHRKLRIKFDHSELMRADPKTMAEVVDKLLTKGVINRNEARQELGKNPIDPSIDANGDKHFIQAGFVWADDLENFHQKEQTNGKAKNGHQYKHIEN